MNIYNTTKGQLITLWVFGILSWLFNLFAMLVSVDISSFSAFLFLFIPTFLTFYTLGRRNYKKK